MKQCTFTEILHPDFLRNLAGERSLERGKNYFRQGKVRSLAQYGDEISAEVWGQYQYTVRLWLHKGQLDYQCSCPVGRDGAFCKHAVATAFAWIDGQPKVGEVRKDTGGRNTPMERLKAYLQGRSHDDLVEIILQQAMADASWRDRLCMKSAAVEDAPDIRQFRTALVRAIEIDEDPYDDYGYGSGAGYGYGPGAGYGDGINSALNGVADLLERGHGGLVLDLLADVPDLMENNFERLGDCEDDLSRVVDRIERLHYQACAIAPPDFEELAEWLFYTEWKSEYGFFSGAVKTYADLLGKAGQAAYDGLIEKHLERKKSGYWESQLLRMRECLIEATGSVEDLAAAISQDLSQPSRYELLVDLYRKDGQIDRALEWGTAALEKFGESPRAWMEGLVAFVIEVHRDRYQWEEAIAVAWNEFHRCPQLESYQQLLSLGKPLQAVEPWRDRAIAYLHDLASGKERTLGHGYWPANGAALLVDVFLWEGEDEQAWDMATRYRLAKDSSLWTDLAKIRARTHPQDVIDLYRPQVETEIQGKSEKHYKKAVKLLKKIRPLMGRLGQSADFQNWVGQLSETHKRKRNFIKLLKQQKWIA